MHTSLNSSIIEQACTSSNLLFIQYPFSRQQMEILLVLPVLLCFLTSILPTDIDPQVLYPTDSFLGIKCSHTWAVPLHLSKCIRGISSHTHPNFAAALSSHRSFILLISPRWIPSAYSKKIIFWNTSLNHLHYFIIIPSIPASPCHLTEDSHHCQTHHSLIYPSLTSSRKDTRSLGLL